MLKQHITCNDCVHWQGQRDSEDAPSAVCSLAGNPEHDHPMSAVNLDSGSSEQTSALALVTSPEYGCNAAVSRHADENEKLWEERIPRIKKAVEERAPHYSQRVQQLSSLLAYLEDYHDAVLASINGYDPEDEDPPKFESAFGDETMEEMIALIRTLPTIPAVIPTHPAPGDQPADSDTQEQ